MKLIKDPKIMLESALSERADGKTIGFVPTMGALHIGHLSLVQAAMQETDVVIASIFINPIQFNEAKDYENYPKTFEEDFEKLEAIGCHYLFHPSVDDFYVEKPVVSFSFGKLETVMEGKNRPGHFNGVGIVVSKLLNATRPHKAFFGKKDLQQLLVIKRMVKDLGFQTEVIGCPTVREESGIAFSSRNMRLSEAGFSNGHVLIKALKMVQSKILEGVPVSKALDQGREMIDESESVELEYLELGNLENLGSEQDLVPGKEYALCGAIWVEGVRLIDNLIFIR